MTSSPLGGPLVVAEGASLSGSAGVSKSPLLGPPPPLQDRSEGGLPASGLVTPSPRSVIPGTQRPGVTPRGVEAKSLKVKFDTLVRVKGPALQAAAGLTEQQVEAVCTAEVATSAGKSVRK